MLGKTVIKFERQVKFYVQIRLVFADSVTYTCTLNVTGPEKTGLIYTKYTYLYYVAYLFFCVCYPNSVSFIEFLRILCLYQEICVKMLCMLLR